MLLGNLFSYHIIEHENGSIKADISMNASHSIFEGHFPGVPVLPGVSQIQAIKEIMEQVLDKDLRYTQVRDIKFMTMVIPANMNVLACEISYSLTDGEYKLSALLKHNEVNVLKLRGNVIPV